MESLELVVIAAVFVVVFALVAWKPKKKQGPRDNGRWKAFQVQLGALYDRQRREELAVKELPKGMKLHCIERNPAEHYFVFADGDGAVRVKISRGMLFSRKRLQVQLDGRLFATVHLAPKGRHRAKLDFARSEDRCSLQGHPDKREFELRRDDRLVAIVSHRATSGSSGLSNGYRVEVLKEEPALRLLTAVLAVEAALGQPHLE